MSERLTEQQECILRCIRERVAEYGESRTVREISDRVGLSSTSSVAYHLRRMRERGVQVETRGRTSKRCPHCGL
ncbi:winged helix DNA-binding protein [Streptomyces sp. NBC_01381]|uniref:LexA family protein n=1 Tax=Streptomyces sp. NBC_01381 TaxID=2903845 RepID=UPI00225455FE|nr:winged helix DNA-binding protein [Streptomyces sp. NBC_01381]MCX4670336.1 winged helix DNA-binding protein [Streptomyces sp. NBC_01381]